MAVMKASEFIEKLKDVVENYKTLYVMGCFGAPLTSSNKTRYCSNHSYNQQATRTKMIQAASADTFGFDCVCLIKAILWGWTGDKKKTYGGANYASNGVPDISADAMIQKCSDVSTDFSKVEVGEALWCSGHIGVYIGDGLAIECTPAWKNKVQITAVRNVGTKTGYNARTWTKHGKLPYIDYDVKTAKKTSTKETATKVKVKKASKPAQNYGSLLAGTYVTTANLNMRDDASISDDVMVTLPKGTTVRCHGYYTLTKGVKWLYVEATYKKTLYVGFCSSRYLKKN